MYEERTKDPVYTIGPGSHKEKLKMYELINSEYKKEFCIEEDKVKIPVKQILYNKPIFVIRHNNELIGFFVLQEKHPKLQGEVMLDCALYKEYVGKGVMKKVMPKIVKLCKALNYHEIYSWSNNVKVKKSLENLGFQFLTDDIDLGDEEPSNKSLYMYSIKE